MKKNGFRIEVEQFPEYMISDRKIALRDLQIAAYKFIIKIHEREFCVLVDINPQNLVYDDFKDKYNTVTSQGAWDTLIGEKLNILNQVVYASTKKSVRRIKKNITRVKTEMRSVYRECISNQDQDSKAFYDAIELFGMVIRDSFVISRKNLPISVYNKIPKDLTENRVSDNKPYLIKDAFAFDENMKRYVFKYCTNNSFNLTKSDLRQINRTIAPYIFSTIHNL